MIFPADSLQLIRHPSQLYEAFFEGLVLFAVLWMIRKKSPFDGFLLAFYVIGYGLVRFFIEFFREPDTQLGFVWASLSMGQVLCILMILAGLAVMMWRRTAAGNVLSVRS
jgi:phosphatidylglycerol:prolipoprotein diacylglycerol transferase